MKNKVLCILLVCESALCIAACLIFDPASQIFAAAVSFPFEQIGNGLRTLSLSSGTGNVFAIAIYAILSLLPAAAILFIIKKRKFCPEDVLLPILSALLFAVLYIMINPGLLSENTGSIGKALLGGVIYTVLLGYAVLRILRRSFTADTNRLQKYISALLIVISAVFVYQAFGASFAEIVSSFKSFASSNNGNEQPLTASYIFIVFRYIVNMLPYVLDIVIVFAALRLINELQKDSYSEESVASSNRLSRIGGIAIVISTILNIAFNILQFVFMKSLSVINGFVIIPLSSIAFAIAALLLSRYIAKNKRLKDKNDMFI